MNAMAGLWWRLNNKPKYKFGQLVMTNEDGTLSAITKSPIWSGPRLSWLYYLDSDGHYSEYYITGMIEKLGNPGSL